MTRRRISGVIPFAALVFALAASDAVRSLAADWPEWRGPLRTGESPTADPPLEWSEARTCAGSIEVPGLGLGSPIVRGDMVLVRPPCRARRTRPRATSWWWRSTARTASSAGAACCTRRCRTRARTRTTATPRRRCSPTASALRLLRVARPLRARPLGQADLGEAAREDADAQRLRRGHSPALYGDTLVVTGTTRARTSSWRSTPRAARNAGARSATSPRRGRRRSWSTRRRRAAGGRRRDEPRRSYDLATGEALARGRAHRRTRFPRRSTATGSST